MHYIILHNFSITAVGIWYCDYRLVINIGYHWFDLQIEHNWSVIARSQGTSHKIRYFLYAEDIAWWKLNPNYYTCLYHHCTGAPPLHSCRVSREGTKYVWRRREGKGRVPQMPLSRLRLMSHLHHAVHAAAGGEVIHKSVSKSWGRREWQEFRRSTYIRGKLGTLRYLMNKVI